MILRLYVRVRFPGMGGFINPKKMKAARLKELLQKYTGDELDEEGRQEFAQMLEDLGGREQFESLLEQQLKNREFETEDDLPGVYGRLQTRLNEYIRQKRTPVVTLPRRKKVYRMWAAAAILLVMITGAALYFLAGMGGKKNIMQVSYKGDVAPGHYGAVLHLSDGRTIVLDSASNGTLAMQGKVQVVKENGTLKYVGKADVVVYNDISTDKGRQWQLVLPDGSKVWLNASSSIHYPLSFTGKERLVEVTGEAYFEVVHNATLPFKVKVGNQVIEDIGTAFNVNAYSNEPAIKTTLVQGIVKVSTFQHSASNIVLKPGEQASGTTNGLKVAKVDVDEVLAWQRGLFSFHHADIQTIMRQLARWYNVEVKYESKVPEDKTFTGEIGRDLTLAQVLRGLQKMNVHIKIEEDKRIVILP
jgi:transmembrane sensor